MITRDSIELLRQQYFQSIIYLQEKKEILDALPNSTYINFFPIVKGLIELIDKEIKNEEKLLATEEKEDEIHEYIKEEIENLNFKKDICNQLLLEAKEKIEIEESAKEVSRKNLIFATTTSGNIYLEKDVKNMNPEFYDRIGDSLRLLELGDTNNIKQIENNSKLTKVWEIKEYQTRLFFKNLSNDTIYIILARIKKDNNSSVDREEAIIRSKKTIREYNKLKQEIKDPIKKGELIEENQRIKDNLFEYITKHRRG